MSVRIHSLDARASEQTISLEVKCKLEGERSEVRFDVQIVYINQEGAVSSQIGVYDPGEFTFSHALSADDPASVVSIEVSAFVNDALVARASFKPPEFSLRLVEIVNGTIARATFSLVDAQMEIEGQLQPRERATSVDWVFDADGNVERSQRRYDPGPTLVDDFTRSQAISSMKLRGQVEGWQESEFSL